MALTPVRVVMEVEFLLRAAGDWREDEDVNAVVTILHAMFEDVSVTGSSEVVGDCTCDSGEPWAGDPDETDADCPWHGKRGGAA